MIELVAKYRKNPVIAAQVRSPYIVESLVKKHKGKLILTQSNSRDLMMKALKHKIDFGGDTKGGFIFPEFQPSFDAMISIAKILEITAKYRVSIAELNKQIPDIHIESAIAPCSWETKGKLMRMLVDKYKNREMNLMDGMRLDLSKTSWVLVRPDPTEPLVHIIAEGKTAAEAKKIVQEYTKIVNSIG
jgi:mannose-1-phosphate guanylyltransferase/phosphomannomutase